MSDFKIKKRKNNNIDTYVLTGCFTNPYDLTQTNFIYKQGKTKDEVVKLYMEECHKIMNKTERDGAAKPIKKHERK